MRKLTNKQMETLVRDIEVFEANFGPVRVERGDFGDGFYIFYPAETNDTYLFFSDNLYEIKGWLYGNVQCAHRVLPLKQKLGIKTEMD